MNFYIASLCNNALLDISDGHNGIRSPSHRFPVDPVGKAVVLLMVAQEVVSAAVKDLSRHGEKDDKDSFCFARSLTCSRARHSSVALSAPTILRPQVQIPSTPFMLFSIGIDTVFLIGIR